MTSLVLLVPLIVSVTAAPLEQSLDSHSPKQSRDTFPVSPETGIAVSEIRTRPSRRNGLKASSTKSPDHHTFLSPSDRPDSKDTTDNLDSKEKPPKKARRNKALFFNYPFLAQLQRYPSLPAYDLDYNDYELNPEERTPAVNYPESNIFYIRLPPTPYMFVPGLGYISQPPTCSTAGLRPMRPVRPVKPRPVYQQPANPFIKLPIDFVSNGKPTSVYQWKKKPVQRPTDSPITNLDELSTEFVSNGKPTSIYQWQTNLKPVSRPEDVVNSLDKGPYVFNGKPASLYLLKPDGSSSVHQPIRYPDYQEDNGFH